jgi:PqqD family protein of HPr-rel-A system
MKWRLISNQAVRLRSWDNEYVIYNSLSGDTHLVGPAAAQILTQLQRAPADVAALADAMRHEWQTDTTEELGIHIRDVLADLHKLALIEEVS